MTKRSKGFEGGLDALKSLRIQGDVAKGRDTPAADQTAKPLGNALFTASEERQADQDLLERICNHLRWDLKDPRRAKKVGTIREIIAQSHRKDVSQFITQHLWRGLFMTGEFVDSIYEQILQVEKRGFASEVRRLLKEIPKVGVEFAKEEPQEELKRIKDNLLEKAKWHAEKAERSLEDIAKEAGINLEKLQQA